MWGHLIGAAGCFTVQGGMVPAAVCLVWVWGCGEYWQLAVRPVGGFGHFGAAVGHFAVHGGLVYDAIDFLGVWSWLRYL